MQHSHIDIIQLSPDQKGDVYKFEQTLAQGTKNSARRRWTKIATHLMQLKIQETADIGIALYNRNIFDLLVKYEAIIPLRNLYQKELKKYTYNTIDSEHIKKLLAGFLVDHPSNNWIRSVH